MWAYGMATITHSRCEFSISLGTGNCDGVRCTTRLLLPQKGMWAYDTAVITHCRLGTPDFSRNLITMKAWGVWHGRYYLKMGCVHTARSLSPTVEMRAYGTAAITHCRNASIQHDRYHPLEMRAYSTAAITHYRSRTRDFSGNLIIVMAWGVWHNRYYLKKGCEHMAWLLSPTVEMRA